MASGFVQTNGRVIAGEGDPAGGDALVTNLSLFPINSLYINNNTGKLWVRNEENSVVGDWVGASDGSGSSFLPETGTGTATGNIIGSLAGFTLNIQQGSNPFLTIDPTTNAEQANFRAYNVTGNNNQAGVQNTTSDTQADANINATFDGGTEQASMGLSASAGGSSITHIADIHSMIANGREYLNLNGTSFATQIIATDGDTEVSLSLFGDGANPVKFTLLADDDTNSVLIEGNATDQTITYTADQHIFNLQNFANNAAAVTGGLSVGALYYTDTAGEGLMKIVL